MLDFNKVKWYTLDITLEPSRTLFSTDIRSPLIKDLSDSLIKYLDNPNDSCNDLLVCQKSPLK